MRPTAPSPPSQPAGGHSCALTTSGTATCWGNNGNGQADAPDGTFTAITTLGYHSCALTTSGTATCWGSNSNGQTDAPDGTFTAIAAGGGNSCALTTSGTATCWGLTLYGQADPTSGSGPFLTDLTVESGSTVTGVDVQMVSASSPDEDMATPQDTAPQGAALEDVVLRDSLIADQESLLNTYRCQFNVDTDAVSGGCANGTPASGPTQPGMFEGTPTQNDVATRDDLIVAQETLLNTYRCQFNVDTHVIPGGCASRT